MKDTKYLEILKAPVITEKSEIAKQEGKYTFKVDPKANKLEVKTPKTKEMKGILETLKIADKKVLLVVKEFTDELLLSVRNLDNVVLILADEINVLDVVGTDVMVITEDALKYVEEVLK